MTEPLQLNYAEYGVDGPPLLILHGLFGSATNWRSIGRQLGERFQVYVLDLRNHGLSPWHDAMDYPQLAADLRHFILAKDLTDVGIIGHSMGGKTAMQLALQYPDRVARLLVVDIAPVAYPHTHAGYIEAMLALDLTTLNSRADADRALQAVIPEVGIRQFLLQNLAAKDGRYHWRVNLPVLHRAMSDLTGFPEQPPGTCYSGPTLFLYGEQSDYVSARDHSLIRQFFPNAKLASVAGAGHWLHAEQPAQVIAQAERFFTVQYS